MDVTIQRTMELEPIGLEVLRFDNIDIDELRLQQEHEYPEEMDEANTGGEDYRTIGGLLCSTKLPYVGAEEKPRIMLPTPYRSSVIIAAHIEVGHSAAHRTLCRIREAYVWPGMRRGVFVFVAKCATCIVHSRKRDRVVMGEGPSPPLPYQVIALDLFGPMVRDKCDNKCALMIIDHCSNWVEGYPLCNR